MCELIVFCACCWINCLKILVLDRFCMLLYVSVFTIITSLIRGVFVNKCIVFIGVDLYAFSVFLRSALSNVLSVRNVF